MTMISRTLLFFFTLCMFFSAMAQEGVKLNTGNSSYDDRSFYDAVKRKIVGNVMEGKIKAYTSAELEERYKHEELDTLAQARGVVQVQVDPSDPYFLKDSLVIMPVNPYYESFPQYTSLKLYGASDKPASLNDVKVIEVIYDGRGMYFNDNSSEGNTLYFINARDLEQILSNDERRVIEEIMKN